MIAILLTIVAIYFGINLLLAIGAICIGPVTVKEFLDMLWRGLPMLIYIAFSTED